MTSTRLEVENHNFGQNDDHSLMTFTRLEVEDHAFTRKRSRLFQHQANALLEVADATSK